MSEPPSYSSNKSAVNDFVVASFTCVYLWRKKGTLPVAPPDYYRRWNVYLRGELIGEVLAATHEAACQRAIHKFRIKPEDRRELEVRRQTQTDARE